MDTPSGPLILAGGAEFGPGNESHDRLLLERSRPGPLLVLPTAAARSSPAAAVATARRWFAQLGADAHELPVVTARDGRDPAILEAVVGAGAVTIAGGDPGHLRAVLVGGPLGAALVAAWRAGMGLSGSSAGAMVLARWVLLRAGWPDRSRRRAREGVGVSPVDAVLPHHETFGAAWLPSARDALGADSVLLGLDERTAVAWDAGAWHATGVGSVTLYGADAPRVLTPGDRVPLPPPG